MIVDRALSSSIFKCSGPCARRSVAEELGLAVMVDVVTELLAKGVHFCHKLGEDVLGLLVA